MENASKALIIAGAILLSILIIGIGMYIYNQAQDQINSSAGQMSQEEVRVFNSQFKAYEGNRVSGSQVKQLLTKLASNAAKLEDPKAKDERKPHINVKTGAGTSAKGLKDLDKADYTPSEVNEVSRNVVSTKTYSVTTSVSNANIINKIDILPVEGTSNGGGTPSPAGGNN